MCFYFSINKHNKATMYEINDYSIQTFKEMPLENKIKGEWVSKIGGKWKKSGYVDPPTISLNTFLTSTKEMNNMWMGRCK